MKTRELIIRRLNEATDNRLSRRTLSAAIRYRSDGEDALRALLREGVVVRQRAEEQHKPGPKPMVYVLAKK